MHRSLRFYVELMDLTVDDIWQIADAGDQNFGDQHKVVCRVCLDHLTKWSMIVMSSTAGFCGCSACTTLSCAAEFPCLSQLNISAILSHNTVDVCRTVENGAKCNSSRDEACKSTVSVSNVRVNAVTAELEYYKVKQQFAICWRSVKYSFDWLYSRINVAQLMLLIVWSQSMHTKLIALHSYCMCLMSGTITYVTLLSWLPVLFDISPPCLQRKTTRAFINM